jgi:hypothetical protein
MTAFIFVATAYTPFVSATELSDPAESVRAARDHRARKVTSEQICEAEFYPMNCIHQELVRKHPPHVRHLKPSVNVSLTTPRPWRTHQGLESK